MSAAVTVPISVLIRTRNSGKTLERVIERLGCEGHDELVVVDSGSVDSTLAIATRLGARVVILEGPFSYGRSLNLGFRAARNPWVLVLSSHSIPLSPRYLDTLRAAIAQFPDNLAVAYGATFLTTKSASAAATRKPRFFDQAQWERRKSSLGGNVNALYRLKSWQQHPFDEALVTAEDLHWCLWALRAGYTAAQIPAAAVLYRNQGSLRRMYAKGLHESRAARQMLNAAPMSWAALLFAIFCFMVRCLLGQIPFSSFLRQCAFQLGAFVGARSP